MGIPLRTLLVAPFVLQIVGITSLGGYLSYRSGQQAVKDLAHRLMEETGDRVIQDLDTYLQTAHFVNQSNQAALGHGTVHLNDLDHLHKHLVLEHQQFPEIRSSDFGTPQGDYRGVRRVSGEALEEEAAGHTSEELRLQAELAESASPGRLKRYAIDGVGHLGQHLETLEHQDVRESRWYRQAVETQQPGWSDPFQADSTGQLMLKAYTPSFNDSRQLEGVFSADLSLERLSRFLRTLSVSESGQVFILERNGLLIANSAYEPSHLSSIAHSALAPTSSPTAQSEESDLHRLSAFESSNPVMRSASQQLKQRFGHLESVQDIHQLQVKVDGDRHFLHVIPYQDAHGLDWLIVTVLPQSEFLGAIQTSIRRTALLSGLALLGSIGFGIWAVRRVTRPLQQLDQATQIYAAGGTPPRSQATRVNEIDSLWRAFEQMMTELDARRSQVEAFHIDYAQALKRQVDKQTQELRAKAEELAEWRDRYDTAARASGQVLFEYGLNTDQDTWGPNTKEVLGYTADAMPQGIEEYVDRIHPDDQKAFRHILQQDRASKRPYQLEFRFRKANGEYLWLEERGMTRYNAQGKPVQVVGYLVDISDRKQVEEALEESRAQFQRLVDDIGAKFVIFSHTGLDGRVTYVSGGFTSVFGLTKEQIIGESWPGLINWLPEDIEIGQAAVVQIMENQADFQQFEMRFTHPYKRQRTVLISQHPARDKAGKLIAIEGILEDITERKRAEQELIQARDSAESANKAKSIFIANISHELRSPLNAILGFARIIKGDARLPSEPREHAEIIEQSGEYLLNIINQVLDLAKVEAKQTAFDPTHVDLWRLLNDLKSLLGLKAEAQGIDFIIERDPALPHYICTDDMKLRQVLINLLDNAFKFTDQGKVVLTVMLLPTTHDHTFRLQFSIADNGPGISPADQALLFKPFSQTQSGQAAHRGTGLGLAISQEFVRLMGGALTVSSQLGKGSVFRFEIHAEGANPASSLEPDRHRKVVGLQAGQPTYRLLIVDDNVVNRRLLAHVLSVLDVEIRQAENGQEALEIWERWHPNGVLIDLRMPVMDGYEATHRIRQREERAASPTRTVIIAVSAAGLRADSQPVLLEDFDDYVLKPFKPDDIFDTLHRRLGFQYQYADSLVQTS